jgi:tetratricopeptide (TPR) repeat protein
MTEEIFLATRRLFESLARERPLVLVFEDLHWADPSFLDFVEYLAERANDAPMLMLCLARGELLELRDTWGGGLGNASSLRLEPLEDEEAELLLDALRANPTARTQVREVAEGNPLFVEQMLAWLEEATVFEYDRGLPPTIQALLAARLDRLGPGEAAVLHRAAIIGRDFQTDAVVALLPAEARGSGPRHLLVLAQKGLLKPLAAGPDDGERFRFAHALVQDAAYRMIPKRLRANLHERFADWLERETAERAGEYEEILGYHLEQAYRYRIELGSVGEEAQGLALRAADRLASAGRRALERTDEWAATNLLSRACALSRGDDQRLPELLLGWASALMSLGEFASGLARIDEAIELARRVGDRYGEWRAAVERLRYRVMNDPAVDLNETLAEAHRGARALTECGDERGAARAWCVIGIANFFLGSAEVAADAFERSIELSRGAGSRRDEAFGIAWLTGTMIHGPMRSDEGIARLEELVQESDGYAAAAAYRALAVFAAMQGRFDQARQHLGQAIGIWTELGARRLVAWRGMWTGPVEMLAGDLVTAESELRASADALEAIGDDGYLCSIVADLARCLYLQGRMDEAEELARNSERLAGPNDPSALAPAWSVRAMVFARRGRHEEAEGLARKATQITEDSDWRNLRADRLSDLAEVLRLGGRPREAAQAIEAAIALYERKGNLVSAGRAQEFLEQLSRHPVHSQDPIPDSAPSRGHW